MSLRLTRVLGFPTLTEQSSARPENVNFALGRTPRLKLWSGGYHHNGLFFYGERPELIFETIKRAARLSSTEFKDVIESKQSPNRPKRQFKEFGFQGDAQGVLYDLGGLYPEEGKALDKAYRNFSYRQPKSLLHLLTDLEEFRIITREAYQKLNLPYDALHRKLVLAFITLGEEELRVLRENQKARRVFLSMVREGYKQRLAILPLVARAQDFDRELIEAFDFVAFMGTDNEAFATEFYGLPIYRIHFGLIHVGLIWDVTVTDSLTSFTSLLREKERWNIEKRAFLKDQDETWEKYLASLENVREPVEDLGPKNRRKK